MRRRARGDRVLFHYNGHGVPRPTENGELWLFNQLYTKYMPVPLNELRGTMVGSPAIYVLDCSGAGVCLPHFLSAPVLPQAPVLPPGSSPAGEGEDGGAGPSPLEAGDGVPLSDESRADIVLVPCAAGELLPMEPTLPADLFTTCLTTPIPMALRWFVLENQLSMEGVEPEVVNHIPGVLGDRKTALGELNWIFTAITDCIAWNVLPRALFHRLFRQDLLVAALFRNFLLADRIFRASGCTPASIPALPAGVAMHPLWDAWDLAAESSLAALAGLRIPPPMPPPNRDSEEAAFSAMGGGGVGGGGSGAVGSLVGGDAGGAGLSGGAAGGTGRPGMAAALPSATFFSEQLTAFGVWLECSGEDGPGSCPEQLPVVLQALLSQAHRLQALLLLRRFFERGSHAVHLALGVGIFQYVIKLLQSPAPDLRQVLVVIWAKILAFDKSCQRELVAANAHLNFIGHLGWEGLGDEQHLNAAFVIACICDG